MEPDTQKNTEANQPPDGNTPPEPQTTPTPPTPTEPPVPVVQKEPAPVTKPAPAFTEDVIAAVKKVVENPNLQVLAFAVLEGRGANDEELVRLGFSPLLHAEMNITLVRAGLLDGVLPKTCVNC